MKVAGQSVVKIQNTSLRLCDVLNRSRVRHMILLFLILVSTALDGTAEFGRACLPLDFACLYFSQVPQELFLSLFLLPGIGSKHENMYDNIQILKAVARPATPACSAWYLCLGSPWFLEAFLLCLCRRRCGGVLKDI